MEHLQLPAAAERPRGHAAASRPPASSPGGDAGAQAILDALGRSAGNQTEAAKLLGISRRTLLNRLDEYDLPRPRKRGG